MSPAPFRAWRAAHALALAAVLCGSGCGSTEERRKRADPGGAGEEALPGRIQPPTPDPIGKFLVDLDVQIQRWSSLVMTARSSEEQRLSRAIEAQLRGATLGRRAELIAQLEGGPPINRVRAATALGFTQSPEAQSPLLNALEDPDPDVVHNALLGLALLELPDTPLERICALASLHPDPTTRSNAMYALRCILAAGGSSQQALPTARTGLVDAEPFVRTQAALALGLLEDEESLRGLADLVHDEKPLVRLAALESIVHIGRGAKGGKGPAARALTEALRKVEKPARTHVRRALVQLAEIDYGDDPEEWEEWARKLP